METSFDMLIPSKIRVRVSIVSLLERKCWNIFETISQNIAIVHRKALLDLFFFWRKLKYQMDHQVSKAK